MSPGTRPVIYSFFSAVEYAGILGRQINNFYGCRELGGGELSFSVCPELLKLSLLTACHEIGSSVLKCTFKHWVQLGSSTLASII